MDPPYLITCATYNEQNDWTEQDERDLLAYLDRVDALAKKDPEDIPFTPDERYPSLNREQLIRGLILALSL